MPVIKAQKLPGKSEDPEKIIGQFCYYFPAYTYSMAKKMPYFRVRNMLKVARQEEARRMLFLTQAVSAPHTKKGMGVKKMLKSLQDIINS